MIGFGFVIAIVGLVLYRGEKGGVYFQKLTSDSPADQRRSMSVKESGEARTWRDVVVRKRSLRAVVRNCMVAVAFDEEAIVLGWSS